MTITHAVGAVAALTGVSVRTLHHYDHIGLVVPSVRTAAGYRGYTDADIERLHIALVYRSAGLPLDEIRAVLDDPDADVAAILAHQHAVLLAQASRLDDTIKAVEDLMNAHRNGIQLTAAEQAEGESLSGRLDRELPDDTADVRAAEDPQRADVQLEQDLDTSPGSDSGTGRTADDVEATGDVAVGGEGPEASAVHLTDG